jgi:hypothetical protein
MTNHRKNEGRFNIEKLQAERNKYTKTLVMGRCWHKPWASE